MWRKRIPAVLALLFLLAGPLSVLYLLGVAAAFLFAPRRKPAAGEAPAKGLTTHGAP